MAGKKNAPDNDRVGAQRHLRELIAALDRRVPHIERLGEIEIVRAAMALRTQAEERLAKLTESDKAD